MAANDSAEAFAGALLRIPLDVVHRIERDVRTFLLDADRQLVLATPRDFGHVARNWLPSIGRARRQVIGRPGIRSDPQQAIAEAERVFGGYQIGTVAYLTNNVSYLPFLAIGSSPQRPQPGWIEGLIRATARKHFGVAA